MPTKLDKDLTRESTVKHNEREIQITLTADQQISFKLKGMKSGMLTISIEDLYQQLAGGEVSIPKNIEVKSTLDKASLDNPMIPLNDLRSMINTTPLEYETLVELDEMIVACIKKVKKPILDKIAAAKEAAKKK